MWQRWQYEYHSPQLLLVVVAVAVVCVVVVYAICSAHIALCGSGGNVQIATHNNIVIVMVVIDAVDVAVSCD